MRIKPVFESAAKANDNPNLVFAAVNTAEVYDCSAEFGVSAIPNFIAFVGGKQVKNFKGANEPMLFQTVAELAEKAPKGRIVSAASHDQLQFKQFKPTHLKPQPFSTLANLDKMKQFIEKFVDSETVSKEVGEVASFKKWLGEFKLEEMSYGAIDELVQMVEVAEDRSKIALIDLLRLLMQYERAAVHILRKHWETIDISIFQYLQCLDIKDPNEKVLHNYHLVSLKMLANIYQTSEGQDFVSDSQVGSQLVQFCEYSLHSANPKTRYTAAVVLFNHVLTSKRDLTPLNASLLSFIKTVVERMADLSKDSESFTAIMLAQTRALYKN
jgi:hypothetical protein